MDLVQARTLLSKARQHQQPVYERSIFALGGRGYYENPTTDLLAFFLDPREIHGFGDCFLRALLGCVCPQPLPEPTLAMPPQREVSTLNGNRIDLLLQGDNWFLILENKILHSQVNPFTDYELHAANLSNNNSLRPYFAVLSPSGKSASAKWVGLSYATYITALREALAPHMQQQALNKWQVLAGEFLLHLENITVERSMSDDSIDFVFENLPQINALGKLRDQAFEALNSKILARLEADIPGYVPYTRRHTWRDGPTLRYACNDWEEYSDVVVFFDCGQPSLRPTVRVYLCNADERLKEQGRQLFTATTQPPWNEGKWVIGFEWDQKTFDEHRLIDTVVEKMKLLMHFEMNVPSRSFINIKVRPTISFCLELFFCRRYYLVS